MKPPYGTITAIDLSKGTQVWQIVHGETPDHIKNHRLLKGVTIPRTGQSGILGTLTTKTLVICGDCGLFTDEKGRKGARLRAYDKATGEQKGAVFMDKVQTGATMTYCTRASSIWSAPRAVPMAPTWWPMPAGRSADHGARARGTLTLARLTTAAIALCAAMVGMGQMPMPNALPDPFGPPQRQWAKLADGKPWGTTAGIEIGPHGEIWAIDRCGDGTCDGSNMAAVHQIDPKTGRPIRSIGAGLFAMPHGLHVDKDGNVWVTDAAIAKQGRSPRASRSSSCRPTARC